MKKNLLLKKSRSSRGRIIPNNTTNVSNEEKVFVTNKNNPDVDNLIEQNIKDRELFQKKIKDGEIQYSKTVWKPIGEKEINIRPKNSDDFLISNNDKEDFEKEKIRKEIEEEELRRNIEKKETEDIIRKLKDEKAILSLNQKEIEYDNDEDIKESSIIEQSKISSNLKENRENITDILNSIDDI